MLHVTKNQTLLQNYCNICHINVLYLVQCKDISRIQILSSARISVVFRSCSVQGYQSYSHLVQCKDISLIQIAPGINIMLCIIILVPDLIKAKVKVVDLKLEQIWFFSHDKLFINVVGAIRLQSINYICINCIFI